MDFCIDKNDPFFETKARLSHLRDDGCRKVLLNNRTEVAQITQFTGSLNILRMMHLNNETVINKNFLDTEPEEDPYSLDPYRLRDELEFVDWMIERL